MKRIRHAIKRIIFWDFERGSWQYDLALFLFVVFVFWMKISPYPIHERPVADKWVYVGYNFEEVPPTSDFDHHALDRAVERFRASHTVTHDTPRRSASGEVIGHYFSLGNVPAGEPTRETDNDR